MTWKCWLAGGLGLGIGVLLGIALRQSYAESQVNAAIDRGAGWVSGSNPNWAKSISDALKSLAGTDGGGILPEAAP